MSVEIKVWLNEKKVPGGIDPAVASALAAFRGRLDQIEAEFMAASGVRKHDERRELMQKIGALTETTLSLVAGSVVGATEVVKLRLDRWEKETEFAEDGQCILLSDIRWDGQRSGHWSWHLWAEWVDAGVSLTLHFFEPKQHRKTSEEKVTTLKDFAAAYEFAETNREELTARMNAKIEDAIKERAAQ